MDRRELPLRPFVRGAGLRLHSLREQSKGEQRMRKTIVVLFMFAILNFSANAVYAVVISDIRTSNPTSVAVVVSWITDNVTSANMVNYGTTTTLGLTAIDSAIDDTHWVQITGLSPQTTYYFEVISDGVVDDNNGAYYTFSTSQVGFGGMLYTLMGRIYSKDNKPAQRAIVYVTVTNNGITSAPLSSLTGENGFWGVNIGNLKDPNTGTVFNWAVGDFINIFIQGASEGKGKVSSVVRGLSGIQEIRGIMLSSEPFPWDVNSDGIVDISDFTLVGRHFSEEGIGIVGDVNSDGEVDISDLVLVDIHFGESTNEGVSEPFPWDANSDGIVDISDLVLVGRHFGESGMGIVGDVNSDGNVDISDLVLVSIHFGESTKKGTGAADTFTATKQMILVK